MNNEIIRLERTFEAPLSLVWKALTDTGELKQWFIDLEEFKLEIGYKFQFIEGSEEKKYLHLCEIVEINFEKKIAYTWRYDGYEGISKVSFELFSTGEKTKLILTHEGVNSFPGELSDIPEYTEGWSQILDVSLHDYLKKKI